LESYLGETSTFYAFLGASFLTGFAATGKGTASTFYSIG